MSTPLPEIRYADELLNSAHAAIADWVDGRIVVYVAPGLPPAEEKKAIARAVAKIAGHREGVVVVPAALAGAGRHHLMLTSATAALAIGALAGGMALLPAARPVHDRTAAPAARMAGPGLLPAARRARVAARTVSHPGAAARPAGTAPAAAPAPASPSAPLPSSPLLPGQAVPVPVPLPAPTLPVTPASPPAVVPPVPVTPAVTPLITHLVCSLNVAGIRICVPG